MDDRLSESRKIAERVRYTEDASRGMAPLGAESNSILARCAHNELQIGPSVTPLLSNRLDLACERLSVPRDAVRAFIYLSPEVQAGSRSLSDDQCLLRFSSALVDLLDADEFGYVVGHELGHFLLRHHAVPSGGSIEDLMRSRASEISVDRIGLLACRSLDTALRAMMKTISGLSSAHLRFDVGAFLKQCEATTSDGGNAISTHPTVLVRTRALLWFSMSETFARAGWDYSSEELGRIDDRIRRDMKRFIDGPAQQLIYNAKVSLLLWKAASRAVSDGAFDLGEQRVVANLVGEETLVKLREFLRDLSASDVEGEVSARLHASIDDLRKLIPRSFDRILGEIDDQVRRAFGS